MVEILEIFYAELRKSQIPRIYYGRLLVEHLRFIGTPEPQKIPSPLEIFQDLKRAQQEDDDS